MTVQMTVRIPDALAEFVDREVANGAKSRAEVIARALRRELRRQQAEHDATIYAAATDLDDLEGLARWSSKQADLIWKDLD
jgi:Arc/MetJ-type ribon-helix-helix transcriptional regulator